MASLYVARTLAQQAADSAALAGAKVFVESGCVTSGSCAAQEANATARAQQVGGLISMEGQSFTISVPFIDEPSQNPQITVQAQISNLHLYFAGVAGWTTAPIVSATATAEAYNPSGMTAGVPTFCTGCVRPWLIPNCDPTPAHASPPNTSSTLCPGEGYLLNPGDSSVTNPGCAPSGVTGEPIQIAIASQPTLFGALDDGSGIVANYQQSITTCNTGQISCGTTMLSMLPSSSVKSATQMGVEDLLHVTATGPGAGQDYILPANVCPPQIQAGAKNPLVTQSVVPQDSVISTSDSIVTAYIWDGLPGSTLSTVPELVKIVGFAQIFVTHVDATGDVEGIILGVAGCGSMADRTCDSSAIHGPTMIPVRLMTP
jgi:hypothetical protein